MHAQVGTLALKHIPNRKGRKLEDYLKALAAAEERGRSRAVPRGSRVKASTKPPTVKLDPSSRARSIDDIAEKAERTLTAERESNRAASRVRRALGKVERQSGDGETIGGTGLTVAKRRETPIQRLLGDKRIGAPELMAAEDIDKALLALTGALFCKSPTLERRDRANASAESPATIAAVERYKVFANVWSRRAKQGDPTLAIIVAAVVDCQPFREIELDMRLRNGSASKAVAAGLRDYAARAGWATGQASREWLVSAGSIFRLKRRRPIETVKSMARRWDKERAA